MSYNSNGKTYTDHPLMDEICYYCKQILKGIVIKNDVLALSKETENSLDNAEAYFTYKEKGYIAFEIFPFDYNVLFGYYHDAKIASTYAKNISAIPEEDRIPLTAYANEYFITHFVEENDYYRMLMGLPPFGGIHNDGSNKYDIKLLETDIPEDYTGEFYPDKPLHEQPFELIEVLYANNTIDSIKERDNLKGSNYSYTNFLADRSIDLYTARKAMKWDILYIPETYYLVEDRFKELYKTNKYMYTHRTYQEFYAQSGEYYDQMMIVTVLAQTFSDMITDVPEWYIRRDIFDIRSCQYFLESYGVDFFNQIPLKYQIRIVKNLNKLIKYKSSNQNNNDILDIFDCGAEIFKYWLFKSYNDSTGTYDLEFVSSKVDESYDSYIKDTKYRTPYDDITLQDEYWDGSDNHDYIKNKILSEDFTIKPTKYMSIEYNISLPKFLYQLEYMLGTILDSNIDTNDILIAVPSINGNVKFKLSNLFLFLAILSDSYFREDLNDDSTKVRYPDITTGTKPNIAEGDDYDWKKKYYSEMYIKKTGRVHAFNTKVNKEEIKEQLKVRHSHYAFGDAYEDNRIMDDTEYSQYPNKAIKEFMIDDFIVGGKYDSIDELMEYYNNNTKCYEKLATMLRTASNQDDFKTIEYVFDNLFTREFDKEYYKLKSGEYAKDTIEVLQDRDYVLYTEVKTLMNESNKAVRQDIIRNIMNDVIDTLEYYFYGTGLDYLFAFTTIASFESIIQYIHLMIGFFKSYKVYFLDPYITYQVDDKIDNMARPVDNIREIRFSSYEWDKLQTTDIISGSNEELHLKDGETTSNFISMADIYAHYEFDPMSDYDYDGLNAEDGEASDYYLLDGGTAAEATDRYITVNGGAAYLGMIDWSTIEGGEALETPNVDYYDIDGGKAYNPYDEKTDAMGSQMFTYIIDGGCAGSRFFRNNNMNLYLVGTQLFCNLFISSRDSNLQITPEGLYLKDKYVRNDSLALAIYDIEDLLNFIDTDAVRVREDIRVLQDINALDARIASVTDNLLYNLEYSRYKMSDSNGNINLNDNNLINESKKAVDEIVGNLDNINTNPYYWEEIYIKGGI